MTLLLTERDVESVLTMDLALACVEAAQRALGAQGVNHPRRRLPVPDGQLHYMTSSLPGVDAFGAKLYATGHGAPRFLVPLYRGSTGVLLALIEADWLGRLRTGAASGVATKFMARADAEVLGVIGTGGQAFTQVLAVCAVRPIKQVRVYGRDPARRAAFARSLGGALTAEVQAVADARAAIEPADVVVTMTSASAPVFDGAWLKAGAHVNAAGSNHLLRREIDGVTVARAARVVADSVEQARLESGDLAAAVAEGALRWEDVLEFTDVVCGRVPGRAAPDEITLFESHGLSAWDIATAVRVYDLARERGLGVEIPLFGGSSTKA
ncbi:MAG: ornithine cyclodeaminase family protein [Anaerolineales bacterium]|nr:ornithine cyclodeaminase family protein [Anaerolineales bacterium]